MTPEEKKPIIDPQSKQKKKPIVKRKPAAKKKKKGKAGAPNKAREILKALKPFENIPFRNYRMLAPLVPCSVRCLEMHYAKGKEDAENDRTRSLNFRFFQAIERSRSLAYMAAVTQIMQQLQKDATTAFKYLAIVDKDTWAETTKQEIKGQIEPITLIRHVEESVTDDKKEA